MPIMPSALYCLWFNCLTRHFQNIYVQACLLLFKSHPWAALWTGSECFENIFAWLLFKYLDIFVQMSGRSCVIYRLQFNSMSGGSEGFSTDIDAREVCHIATGLQVPCKCNAAIQAAHNNSGSAIQFRQHKAVELHRSAAGCLIQVLNMCNTRRSSVWQGMTASRSLESAQMQGEVEQSSAGPGLQL